MDQNNENEIEVNSNLESAEEQSEQEFSLEIDFVDEERQIEKEWKERVNLNESEIMAAIEAIIFMNDRPVSVEKIRNHLDKEREMPIREVHDAISCIQDKYESESHGLRLVEVAEGYQFRTKLKYVSYIDSIYKSQAYTLTPSALEVMAIIAYRQPISRTEIEKLRGVDSSHIVRTLMEKRLVAVAGRSDELGRPTVYKTTSEFLEYFNLRSLEELPDISELEQMASPGVGEISEIKEIVKKGVEDQFEFDDIDELEKLSGMIKSAHADTDFTKSLKQRAGEGETQLSPYELIEAYLLKEEVIDVNNLAKDSEVFTAITDVEIINDLSAGPFNVPEAIDPDEIDDLLEAQGPADESEELDIYEEMQADREQLIGDYKDLKEDLDNENLKETRDLLEDELDDSDLDDLEKNLEDLQDMMMMNRNLKHLNTDSSDINPS